MTPSHRSRAATSSPACGSSRSHIAGRRASSQASPILRDCPADSVRAGIEASRPVRPTRSSAEIASSTGRRIARSPKQRFSVAESSGYRAGEWPSRPTWARRSRRSPRRSQPRTVPVPDRTARRPATRCRRLVFPAPFGPRTPTTLPSSTSRSTPARTGNCPSSATTARSVTAGAMGPKKPTLAGPGRISEGRPGSAAAQRRVFDTAARSDSTISSTISLKSTLRRHPRMRSALEASPTSASTSAGR